MDDSQSARLIQSTRVALDVKSHVAHAFRSPIGTNYLRELQGSGGNRAEFEEARERCFELAASDPEAFFRSIRTLALGYDLPPNRVQQDEYWLFANDRIFGSCRIRHRLIAMTELDRGHIAYEIRPSARRQGYGTAILRLALTKARLLDLDRVLLTTHPSNHGSIRVIEKNGGEFQDECLSPFTGETVHRYWISL